MTPAEIITNVRSQFDDASSAFLTDTELYSYINQGLYELCAQSDILQKIDTSITTVNGTATYDMPGVGGFDVTTYPIFIKIQQITWNGNLLFRKDLESFQAITGNNPSNGNPQYYNQWGKVLTLTPTPTTAQTVKIWGFGRPPVISASVADADLYAGNGTTAYPGGIEEAYQNDIIDYILMRAYYKDDDTKAIEHKRLWEMSLQRIKLEQKQRDNMGAHSTVTCTDDSSIIWSDL